MNAARAAGLEFRILRPGSAMFALVEGEARHLAHVHIREMAAESELRDLRFRDFLRTHPEAVRRYNAAKREIAMTAVDRAAYASAKESIIGELAELALKWAEETAWTPSGSNQMKGIPPGSQTGR